MKVYHKFLGTVGFCALLCLVYPGFGLAARTTVAMDDIIVSDAVPSGARTHLDKTLLLGELIGAVQGTNKFIVVSRQEKVLKSVREEQAFAKTSAAAGDAAFSEQMTNAKYKLIPEVVQFTYYSHITPVPNLPGKYNCSDHGNLIVKVSVAETTTAQTPRTYSLETSFNTPSRVISQSKGSPSITHFTSMAKTLGAKLADELIDFIYPMKVVDTDGISVWINRGRDGGLKTGQRLNIYSPGKELFDPDTGERLGSAEKYIGPLKVIEVKPSLCVAEIEDKSHSSLIHIGCIVREPQSK